MTSVTEALRTAIDDSDESIYSIAKKTGITYPSLWYFVRGKSSLNGRTIDTLCDYLGLHVSSSCKEYRTT